MSSPLLIPLYWLLGRMKKHDVEAPPVDAGRRQTIFQRYDTGYTDEHNPPHQGWLRRVWGYIRPNEPEVFNPQYRRLPIVSGLLVPFSILMEIPGLTEHWYAVIDGKTGNVIQYQPNSALLEAGLSISMASAVIANICLLARFLERHVRSNTISAMLFLTIHDIINVVTLITFGYSRGRRDDGYSFAQAFWFTIASTAISSITNVTLFIDFLRIKDFARSGSGLSHKQRSLVIITIILFSWVAVGAGVFAALLEITFQDSLYFTIVTMETIGYGDIAPGHSAGARVFTCFYIATAIFNLALAVTTIADVVAEGFRHAARKRRIIAKRRKQRRQQRRALKAAREADEFVSHGGGRRTHDPMKYTDMLHMSTVKSFKGELKDILMFWKKKKHPGEDDDADDNQIWREYITTADEGHDGTPIHEEDKHLFMPRTMSVQADDSDIGKELSSASTKENLQKLGSSFLLFLVFWCVGGVIFSNTEGWAFGSAMYFCFITFTTVGYGDLYPTSPAGRAIFTFWAIAGVGSLSILISVIGEAYADAFSSAVDHGAYDTQVYARLQQRKLQERVDELEAQQEKIAMNKTRLDSLAADLIAHARTYHPHMRHVLGIDGAKHRADEPPTRGLRDLLLNEMEQEDAITQRVVLKHPEMRKTVFTMAYDRSFDRLMQAALALTDAIDLTDLAHNYSADIYQPNEPGPSRIGSPARQPTGSPRPNDTANTLADAVLSSMAFDDDPNYDLGTTDNYVDNHVVS